MLDSKDPSAPKLIENLGAIHAINHIKDQIPKINYGLVDAYKDIIPALIKQKEDPNYSIKMDISQTQKI